MSDNNYVKSSGSRVPLWYFLTLSPTCKERTSARITASGLPPRFDVIYDSKISVGPAFPTVVFLAFFTLHIRSYKTSFLSYNRLRSALADSRINIS